MKVLLDTSIFIGQEAGRIAQSPPDEATISIVTVAELFAGVLLAKDEHTRARRLLTYSRAEHAFEAIPIDDEVARTFASIYAQAKAEGHRPKAMDLWIAATAVQHDLTLFTQDSDFDAIPQIRVTKV